MQIHEDTMRILQESESIIRQLTRGEKYWLAVDDLAEMWFGNLLMPDPLVQRAIVNLTSAIDMLYESCAEEGRPDPDRVRALGEALSAATQYTGKDFFAPSRRELLSATEALIHSISHEAKAFLDSDLASDAAETWWVLWRKVLQEYIWQQVCSVQLPADASSPRKYPMTSFSEGVGAYLDDCAESIGVSPALVGILPFSTKLKGDQLSELIHVLQNTDLLHTLSVRFRLAYDATFDPGEVINTGLAGYAAMTGTSLHEARPQAAKHADMINSKLWREWDRRSGPLIERIDRVEKQYKDMAIGPVLSRFLKNSDQLVETILRKSVCIPP
jgi:hypothetical protein